MQAYIPGSMLNNFEHESIVGTPLLLKEGDLGPSKIESLGGVQNFLLERVDKSEKGGGVDVGGCHFFISLQFNHISCVCREVRFPLLLSRSLVF